MAHLLLRLRSGFQIQPFLHSAMANIPPGIAAKYGLSTNLNGGAFNCGLPYDITKKLEVALAYQKRLDETPGMVGRPNKAEIARHCHVSRAFVMKVEEELLLHGKAVSYTHLTLPTICSV